MCGYLLQLRCSIIRLFVPPFFRSSKMWSQAYHFVNKSPHILYISSFKQCGKHALICNTNAAKHARLFSYICVTRHNPNTVFGSNLVPLSEPIQNQRRYYKTRLHFGHKTAYRPLSLQCGYVVISAAFIYILCHT